MCTSSTATPAATDGSLARGEEAEQRPQALAAGRERLAGDLLREPRPRGDRRASPASTSAMYAASPGVACTCASCAHCGDSRVQRDDRAAEQAEAHVAEAGVAQQVGEPLGGREALHRRGQVRVRRRRRAAPCRAAGRCGRTRARRTAAAAPRGCVISRIASRPPGRSTRRSSRSASSRSATLRTPKPTVAASNVAVGERQREHVALHPLDAGALRRARSSICSREVEPGHARRARLQVGDREVAGAARRVEHAVAGPHGRLCGEPAPAQVEARRHDAVHHVVHRRDPVEHRAHRVGRERHGCAPPRRRARCRGRAGRARARRRSRRGRRRVSAPW